MLPVSLPIIQAAVDLHYIQYEINLTNFHVLYIYFFAYTWNKSLAFTSNIHIIHIDQKFFIIYQYEANQKGKLSIGT